MWRVKTRVMRSMRAGLKKFYVRVVTWCVGGMQSRKRIRTHDAVDRPKNIFGPVRSRTRSMQSILCGPERSDLCSTCNPQLWEQENFLCGWSIKTLCSSAAGFVGCARTGPGGPKLGPQKTAGKYGWGGYLGSRQRERRYGRTSDAVRSIEQDFLWIASISWDTAKPGICRVPRRTVFFWPFLEGTKKYTFSDT